MRKTLKLSITLVLACLMLFTVAIVASAETAPTASGVCGRLPDVAEACDNVIWEYYEDTQTLIVSGTGPMVDFETQAVVPWTKYRALIQNLVIEEGITTIGKNAFINFDALISVVIPDSVETINRYAFMNCDALETVEFGTGVKTVAHSAFAGLDSLKGVYIKDLAAWCGINFTTGVSNPASRGAKQLYLNGELLTDLVIPAEVTRIEAYAFYSVLSIKSVTLHDNIEFVGRGAFNYCNYLTTITLDNCSFETGTCAFNTLARLKSVIVNNLGTYSANKFSTTGGNPLRAKLANATREKQFGLEVDGVRLVKAVANAAADQKEVTLTFPENTTKLGNQVFFYRQNLTSAIMPASITSINGDTTGTRNKGAFQYAKLYTIYGVAGSYAETFAKNNGYAFKAITPVEVTGIELDKAAEELTIGSTLNLAATVAPADATFSSVIWTSDNMDVARVSAGKVTALAAGTATIKASTSNGAFTATCVITVPAIKVTGITLGAAEATLKAGHTLKLVPTVAPANASDKTINWTSSVATVATVENGVVKAAGNGTTVITATTVDGSFTATCTVTVYGFVDAPETIPVTGVALDTKAAILTEGEQLKLVATVTPADATDASVTWTSDAENVATVKDGVVTAVSAGNAIITVKTTDGGFEATCNITVEAAVIKVEGVELSQTEATLEIDEQITLTATVKPADATDASVTWSSDAENVATVENGVVTAVSAGTAVITVKTTDGEFEATCTITVNEPELPTGPIEAIALDVEEITLVIGKTYKFKVIFTPEGTEDTNIFWETTKSSVASIEEYGDGTVTAKAVGTAIITVVSEDNEDLYAECVVNVVSGYPVEAIALNKTTSTMTVGDVETLTVTFTPEDATNKNVTWTTTDDQVVTVVDGVVTAVGSGVATVTVTSEDGGFTASCKYIITVGNEVPPIQW